MVVNRAFINRELIEDIYMDQPERFQVKGHEDKVYKLRKSIYRLKQAFRVKTQISVVLELGFVKNKLEFFFYTLKWEFVYDIISICG